MGEWAERDKLLCCFPCRSGDGHDCDALMDGVW